MSLLEITVQPSQDVTHFRTSVTLEGARYVFDFYTNTADGAWYFDLENDDGSAVIRGIALANGIDMLYPYRHLDLPPGALFIQDKDLRGADPDLRAFPPGRADPSNVSGAPTLPPGTLAAVTHDAESPASIVARSPAFVTSRSGHVGLDELSTGRGAWRRRSFLCRPPRSL